MQKITFRQPGKKQENPGLQILKISQMKNNFKKIKYLTSDHH